MSSQHDKAAVQALLSRYSRLFNKKKVEEAARDEITKRIITIQVEISNYKPAFAVFGFNVSNPDVWKEVKELIGEQAYQAALEEAAAPVQEVVLPAEKKLEDKPSEIADAKAEDKPEAAAAAASTPTETPQTIQATPTVRESVLDQLKLAGDQGIKAGALRAFHETAFSTRLHEKTIGMTLYRLSNDGLARREGRVWFYVPPKGETKNPGGETPGNIEVLL